MTTAKTIYLNDYQVPSFGVEKVNLCFILHPSHTEVTSRVDYKRNPQARSHTLELNGFELILVQIKMNGELLSAADYQHHARGLCIPNAPDTFELEITTRINPEANTALEGLYRSSGNYCTQCEAQGFRRITYYQDRPDVMAPFTVKIIADKATNPVLLSNGNPTASGDLSDGLHWAEWVDPFAKPCYLFALVAGDLSFVEDSYHTISGRDVTLRIFTEEHHIHQCHFAMQSLKRAMAWDEQRFNLEYDLDLFMIVAVDDFNMGAMENKGLNIFNSRLVFASPETATDADYISIEAVIGHEYFHNWTGDRVTCRDWFQLSLKEGLTVFRDQEFTSDLHARAVKRIEDVRMLRTHQFAEDASPMAHPIRPASYMEINNFYTVTVYEKGAEVVRLYQTLLGIEGFKKGLKLYFERHDGQAVTTEDFLSAMADANQQDLSQMQRWYDQAGTPTLSIRMDYNEQQQTCTLHCRQSCLNTSESNDNKPFLIPLTLALLDQHGDKVALQLIDENKTQGTSRTLLICEQEQTFTFTNIQTAVTPSLLQNFSAPVILDYPYTANDYAFLMQHDSDAFNGWAAAQAFAMETLVAMIENNIEPSPTMSYAFKSMLMDEQLEPALKAEALMLPSEADIAAFQAAKKTPVNPDAIYIAREKLRLQLATDLHNDLLHTYKEMSHIKGLTDQAMQQRKLKNVCLSYLMAADDEAMIDLAYDQYQQADNMTDQYAALLTLSHTDSPQRSKALKAFEQQWSDETNVMDKWFAAQALSPSLTVLDDVIRLMSHKAFIFKNPNKVRALIGTLAMRNPKAFHAVDGKGYAFVADQVIALDAINPQVASRMVRSFTPWKQMESVRKALMKEQLERILNSQNISADVFEIVSKSL